MHSFLGTAFGSRVSSSAWMLGAVLFACACGPIGGVEAGDGTPVAAQGGGSTGTSASAMPFMPPAPPAFKTVGYMPSWAGNNYSALQFDKLDYILFAFGTEHADGTVALPQPVSLLAGLVSIAHSHNVRVLLSIGGWNNGDDSAYNAISASTAAQATFASTIGTLCDEYQLDGVDIDWEYPDANVTQGYTSMMQTLSATLKPKNKTITIAGPAFGSGAAGITTDAAPYIDLVNVMAYDDGQGAPMSFAQSSLALWSGKGFPASKLVLGVPFYSQPSNTPYSTLVMQNPAASMQDAIVVGTTTERYNGIPTVQAKTVLAMQQAGGIMAWDLSQDSRDTSVSLLSAINAQIAAAGK